MSEFNKFVDYRDFSTAIDLMADGPVPGEPAHQLDIMHEEGTAQDVGLTLEDDSVVVLQVLPGVPRVIYGTRVKGIRSTSDETESISSITAYWTKHPL